jgi:hypothetical protein
MAWKRSSVRSRLAPPISPSRNVRGSPESRVTPGFSRNIPFYYSGKRNARAALRAWAARANAERTSADVRAALKRSLQEEAAGKGRAFVDPHVIVPAGDESGLRLFASFAYGRRQNCRARGALTNAASVTAWSTSKTIRCSSSSAY